MNAEYIGEKMIWTVGFVQAPGCVLTVPMPASTRGPEVPPSAPAPVPAEPPSFDDASPVELLPHAAIAARAPSGEGHEPARQQDAVRESTHGDAGLSFGNVDSRAKREALDAA